jgi:uncharacterized protein YcaQ
MAAQLTWAQAAAWRFSRHHLLERRPVADALDVVEDIAGLHAQVMSSAELSLHARVDGLERDAVQRMLWEQRSLYKTWAMRGTLHLLTARERGLWQAALSTYRREENRSWLNGWKLTREQVERLLDAVDGALRDAQLTRSELAAAVAERTGDADLGERVHGSWGPFLKPSAFRGQLCFGPSSGQNVTFTHPDTWLAPADEHDPQAALREIVRRYLGAYGPATREDLHRWWAFLTPAAAGRLLAEVAEEVDVEGLRAYMLAEHVAEAQAAAPAATVRLLPAFDPYVAGAPRAGHGIFPVERRAEIYRQAGWLTPVIVVDGVIAGVFRQERKGSRLEVALQPFARLPKRAVKAAGEEAERVAAWLGLQLDLTV